MATATQDKPVTLRYGSHERQVIQMFRSGDESGQSGCAPLLVFIHGGAWRSESIEEHVPMAKKIAQRGITVALVEYRLSLRDEKTGVISNQHPAHLEDVFAALRLLVLDQNHDVCLAGHSVGAWMISAALLDCDQAASASSLSSSHSHLPPCPSLGTPSERVIMIRKVKAWIGLDGIYDVQSLLQEYPDYAGFVSQAFINVNDQPLGPDDTRLKGVSLPAWPCDASGHADLPHVYIAHSKDDELLSFRQSIEAARQFMSKLNVDQTRIKEMKLPGSPAPQTISHAPPFVNVDLASLTGKHRPMLETDDFAAWIADIVHRETQR